MKQQTFEAERSERWQRFEQLLEILDRGAHDTTGEFPSLFRQLCQDLSLARDRMFTEDLVTRLNRLALKGHEHLYASRVPPRSAVLEFAARGFPRAVRQEGPLVLALSGLFFGSLGLCAAAVVTWPELAPSFLGSDSLTQLREMYGEDLARRPSDDLQMFGFYIWNNVSIAFRMFAGGLLVGIGSLIALLYAARLEIEVRTAGLFVRIAPFQRKFRHVPAEELRGADIQSARLRVRRGWRIYAVKGAKAVQLRTTTGHQMLIGTQEPDLLAAALLR